MTNRILSAILFTISLAGFAQAQQAARFQPTHEEMVKRYVRAASIDSATAHSVFRTTVTPEWQADGHSFWYLNYLADSIEEYIFVNPAKRTRRTLFDMQRLADALAVINIPVDPLRPSLTNIRINDSGNMDSFTVNNNVIIFDAATYTCRLIAPAGNPATTPRDPRRNNPFPDGAISPDKKWEASIEKGNLFVKQTTGGKAIQLTKDGTPEKQYGSIRWSPDSKYLAGYLIKTVKDQPVYYVLTAEPNSTRGQLRSQDYKQPGDPWNTYTLYLFDPALKKSQQVNTDSIDFLSPPQLRWRTGNSRYFTYEKMDRGHQRFRVIDVDALDNTTRNIVDEKTNSFIYNQRNFTRYLPETNQLIRTSEKSGWQQLYLVDLVSGKETPITQGSWVVRRIDSVDIRKKEIWFTACGMNAGEDPYNIHYYRISFDGKKLVSITPARGNHVLTFSPDHSLFTDTWSEVNTPPQTILARTSDGKTILPLEQADLTVYKRAGVSPPEVFVAKGRDGVTDIWGIVSKPSDLDPSKKYPVLENIYAGPHDAFVPKVFTPYSEMQSLAELGFIVVMIDGMGTANRSKAFHDIAWKNIADAGLPDRILWIKALAAKYSFVDAERVGLYGTSAGGQNTLGALLFHPEFYKAGVSACGCHDNRIDKQWWNEQWMGYPVGKHYDEQSNITNAAKLQGNLLLIVGEADTNVPPESTYRVADALIRAKRDFQLLSIPGMGHSDGGVYGRMKKRDFFVKNLLGVEPPARNKGEIPAYNEVGRERWSFE
ncbi:MAG: S9 family peptidase [Chitinophagaceae bacterium]|nr:MAG: S9 family peptidase [Chitinophagaceae bacterium]